MKKILITGTSGFIGFHLAKLLLNKGHDVHGYDGMINYYDLKLKYDRQNILQQNSKFSSTTGKLEDFTKLHKVTNTFQPDYIIHLAAQAGVRYSIEKPREFIDSNIIGTFNILEIAKKLEVKHLLMASTSSVYGNNLSLPFNENEKTDKQLSIYAATKKANECMAYSYSHLWKIPTTICRFFTVYGPWGRPDMALYKFISAILHNKKIDIYNHGDLYRDFTYIEDVVHGISLLMNAIPENINEKESSKNENISAFAPYRLVNIGNSNTVKLTDFIEIIEEVLEKKAIRNYMPMQKGDIKVTAADISLFKKLTGFCPKTNIKDGIVQSIKWYRKYYNV